MMSVFPASMRVFFCVLLLASLPGALAASEQAEDPLVRDIQQDLKALGYEVDTVDGLYGPNTRRAIEAFQKDRGHSVTGAANEALRETLRRVQFQRSHEARQSWRLTRLYLDALGYDPGEGGFQSERAVAAMAAFIEDTDLETRPFYSERLHRAVVERVKSDPQAQSTLCRWHVNAKSYDDGLPWCTRAAARDDVEAQYLVGWMYYYGRGTPQSYPMAFRWYHRAAQGGDSRAQTYVGLMYRQGKGVRPDPDAAYQWYLRAAGE